ncbi:MAG: CHRD domain-containing protein [Bacteroidetes bacterium]|nr:MAG: CHRD domain-containing protein [Bacteroidota bacterium]
MLIFSVLFLAGISACDKEEVTPIDLQVESLGNDGGSDLKAASGVLNFTAHLSGGEEVPANDSRATGQAIFKLNKAGDVLSYKLIVAHLENVLQSHIHLAVAGQNGPVVVFLYPPAPPAVLIPGFSSGILQTGEITSDDLRGLLAGQDLSALLDQMKTGGAYVNAHTTLFPGGEIRGQIQVNGLVD